MIAAKHTPGPWVFDGRSGIYAVEFRQPGKVFTMEDGTEVPSTEGLVALPYSCGATTAEGVRANHQANARLIAAAPELLSELQKAHQIILNALAVMTTEQKIRWAEMNGNNGVDGEGTTRYHERAAVIAKATGETA